VKLKMRKYVLILIGVVAILATIGLVTAGYGSGDRECDQQSFVDEDGDGVCDNWVDSDGDGVNDNCEGSGYKYQYKGTKGKRLGQGNCNCKTN
jgi:hypothetical protein